MEAVSSKKIIQFCRIITIAGEIPALLFPDGRGFIITFISNQMIFLLVRQVNTEYLS